MVSLSLLFATAFVCYLLGGLSAIAALALARASAGAQAQEREEEEEGRQP